MHLPTKNVLKEHFKITSQSSSILVIRLKDSNIEYTNDSSCPTSSHVDSLATARARARVTYGYQIWGRRLFSSKYDGANDKVLYLDSANAELVCILSRFSGICSPDKELFLEGSFNIFPPDVSGEIRVFSKSWVCQGSSGRKEWPAKTLVNFLPSPLGPRSSRLTWRKKFTRSSSCLKKYRLFLHQYFVRTYSTRKCIL